MNHTTSPASVERARNLLFLSTPALWDAWPFLPLIRRQPGHTEECGLLYDVFHTQGSAGHRASVYFCNLFLLPPMEAFLQLPREVYDTVAEVYAAGWRVA